MLTSRVTIFKGTRINLPLQGSWGVFNSAELCPCAGAPGVGISKACHKLVILLNRREMKADHKKECDEIVRKFEEIRMRGRKRTMVG